MRSIINGFDLNAVGLDARLSSHRAGTVLAASIPAKNVLLEWTADREVPTRLTFVAPRDWTPDSPYDPLANYGQRVRLTALVESSGARHDIHIGDFLITEWEEEKDEVKVTAMDLIQVLAENPAPFPSSPPPGATLSSELQRICAGLTVVLDCENVSIPRDLQFGHDRAEALKDLCKAAEVSYAVKADGYLHVFKSDEKEPVEHYTEADVLIDGYRSAPPRRANQVLVVGAENTGAHALVKVDMPPFDSYGYGTVTQRIENDAVKDSGQAHRVAAEAARDVNRSIRRRSLSILADPRLEGGDIISVTSGAETVTGRVVAYSINFSDPSQFMRVDIEVEQW